MESCLQLYIRKVVDSIMHNLEQKHSNLLFVKHYNTLDIDGDAIRDSVEQNYQDVYLLFHEFSSKYMQSAYEPILDWIMELYGALYSDISIDDFLDNANVYYQSKAVIKSYLETGFCKRSEDVILAEVKYETSRFIKSLCDILLYISKEHTLFMVLNKLHFSEKSTLMFISEFIKCNPENIALLANYNEVYTVPEYTKEDWSELIPYLELKGLLIDWSLQNGQSTESEKIEPFEPITKNISAYIKLINNMVACMAIEQANRYLEQIHSKFEIEKITIPLSDKVSYLQLYVLTALCLGNSTMSIMLCDNISNLLAKSTNYKMKFGCYYLWALSQLACGQYRYANNYVKVCKDLAEKIDDDKYYFRAKLLGYVVALKGWTNIFSWDIELTIDDEFDKTARKFGYYNHLAYIYLFGCCNDKIYFENGENTIESAETFKKGMALAKMLDNETLMLKAWQKNVMMASSYDCFSSVDYFYSKCLEIIDGQNNKFEEATIYNGLGYNRIVSEEFDMANNYFNRALEIFFQIGDPNYIAETLYNMATNAILAHDYLHGSYFLKVVIDLLDALNEHKLRISNLAKLYGMLVLCNYYLGVEYNANLYFGKMERALSHMLRYKETDTFYLWDDDMFNYFFTAGLLCQEEDPEKAQRMFSRAKIHMMNSAGNLFFTYCQFALAQADLFIRCGKDEEANEILNEALEFCSKHNYKNKVEMLQAKLEGKEYKLKESNIGLENITQSQLEALVRRCGIERELKEKTKGLNFLISWQDLLNRDYANAKELVQNAMANIQNSYNIDNALFIDVNNDLGHLMYCSKDIELTNNNIAVLVDYFTTYKKEFTTSRFDKSFDDYDRVLTMFDKNGMASAACVPLYNNEKLSGILIAIIRLHENLLSNILFLGNNDLMIFKFAGSQILDAIERLNSRIEIKAMNAKLQRSAITDLLTGLLNRQGFAKKFEDIADFSANKQYENRVTTVLYIDLDNFKYCNDTFGHDIGDVVLKEISKMFTELVGKDGYIVRYGGDEFVIVLPGSDTQDGVKMAKLIYETLEKRNCFIKEISQALNRAVEIDKAHRISCSIGIATTSKYNHNSVTECLKHADSALYDVKKGTKHDYKVWSEE